MITLNNIVIKESEIKCIEFRCMDDLSPFIDSMLFDSHEDEIAYGEFKYKNKIFNIRLEVNGYVKVFYKGDCYKYPSDFPEELKEKIKNNPGTWYIYAPSGEGNDDKEGDVYIDESNWFEFIYGIKENDINIYQDGTIYENDLSKDTPQGIYENMLSIAEWYFDI